MWLSILKAECAFKENLRSQVTPLQLIDAAETRMQVRMLMSSCALSLHPAFGSQTVYLPGNFRHVGN